MPDLTRRLICENILLSVSFSHWTTFTQVDNTVRVIEYFGHFEPSNCTLLVFRRRATCWFQSFTAGPSTASVLVRIRVSRPPVYS